MTKLKRTRTIYTSSEHGTCVLFRVPPSFALTENKSNLACAISPIGVNSPLNESNEEERNIVVFHSSFPFFQDHAIKSETDLELLNHVASEDRNKGLHG